MMKKCEICERDNWEGMICGIHKVCDKCVRQLVDEYFNRKSD